MCLKSVVLFYVAMNSHIVIDCIQFSVPTMHFMPFSVQYLFFIVWYFFSMNTCLVYAVLDIRATPVSHSLPIISSNICVFKREANFFLSMFELMAKREPLFTGSVIFVTNVFFAILSLCLALVRLCVSHYFASRLWLLLFDSQILSKCIWILNL